MFTSSKFHKFFRNLIDSSMKNTTRRDRLMSLEDRARHIWERYQYFTVEPNSKPKYFQTFPYPYMNGSLHLGHAFSMTKCDFNAWYKRLAGYNVLFPFGFHCTGTSSTTQECPSQLQPKNFRTNWKSTEILLYCHLFPKIAKSNINTR